MTSNDFFQLFPKWLVVEEIRSPEGITEEILGRFSSKRRARNWMFEYANQVVTKNPFVSRYPLFRGAKEDFAATGKVEAEEDEIRIKSVKQDGEFHNRFLYVRRVRRA